MSVEAQPSHLLEAQFYMGEIDRREAVWTARRDFWMETIIILLILGELILGYLAWREGGQQTTVLQELQQSAAATAKTLVALQGVTEATNNAIQSEYQLTYRITLNIIPQPLSKWLTIANTGQRRVRLVGTKIAAGLPSFNRENQWEILQGQIANVPMPELFDELLKRLPRPGLDATVGVELYFQSDDGSEWVGKYLVNGKKRTDNGLMEAKLEPLSCTKQLWPQP